MSRTPPPDPFLAIPPCMDRPVSITPLPMAITPRPAVMALPRCHQRPPSVAQMTDAGPEMTRADHPTRPVSSRAGRSGTTPES